MGVKLLQLLWIPTPFRDMRFLGHFGPLTPVARKPLSTFILGAKCSQHHARCQNFKDVMICDFMSHPTIQPWYISAQFIHPWYISAQFLHPWYVSAHSIHPWYISAQFIQPWYISAHSIHPWCISAQTNVYVGWIQVKWHFKFLLLLFWCNFGFNTEWDEAGLGYF